MLLNLREIHAFQTIVDCGSLGKAAEVLHVTQPALSRIVKRLEEQLGVPLFERHQRGARVTGQVEPAESLLRVGQGSGEHRVDQVGPGREVPVERHPAHAGLRRDLGRAGLRVVDEARHRRVQDRGRVAFGVRAAAARV